MTNWFLTALIAPFLYSIVNHLDKYILSKYIKGAGVAAILIFSCVSSLILLPLILFYYHTAILNITVESFSIMLLAGFMSATALYLYLKAMDIEEASMVIPIYQLIPIFGYFLSYFILNEKLNTSQIFACLLILAGILLLTLEFDVNRKIKFKTKVLFLVATSSFLFALHDTLFKMVAITESFWITVFWQYFSIAVFGLLLLIFVKKFRMSLVQMLSFTRKKILSLNVLSEGLYILGNLASNFATLLAPVALVLVIGSLQPLFVFIIGTLLSIFIPSLSHEKLSKQHMLQKIASIVLILAGSWFLFAN